MAHRGNTSSEKQILSTSNEVPYLFVHSQPEEVDEAGSRNEANTEEADSALLSFMRMAEFWNRLEENEKKTLIDVTADLPVAPNDMGGLNGSYRTMAENKHKVLVKLLLLFMMWGQSVLNLYNDLITAKSFLTTKERIVAVRMEESMQVSIKLNVTHISVCFNSTGRVMEDRASYFQSCAEFAVGTWLNLQISSTAEAAIMLILFCANFGNVLWFLCLSGKQPDGNSLSERAEFIGTRTFAFVYLPKLASNFSFLKCLNFGNPETLLGYIRRHDERPYIVMLCQEIFGCKKLAPCYERDTHVLCSVLTLFLCLGLFCIGMQILVLKLHDVVFVIFEPYRDWDFLDWVAVLAFVSQLMGITQQSAVELNRTLLFKFTAEHCRWFFDHAFKVNAYMCLLMKKVTGSQRFQVEHPHFHGIICVALFANFSADDLQHLLLSTYREHSIRGFNRTRREVIDNMYNMREKSREELVVALRGLLSESLIKVSTRVDSIDQDFGEQLRLSAQLGTLVHELTNLDGESGMERAQDSDSEMGDSREIVQYWRSPCSIETDEEPSR